MEIETKDLPNGYIIALSHFNKNKEEIVSIFIDENDYKEEEMLTCMKRAFDELLEKEKGILKK